MSSLIWASAASGHSCISVDLSTFGVSGPILLSHHSAREMLDLSSSSHSSRYSRGQFAPFTHSFDSTLAFKKFHFNRHTRTTFPINKHTITLMKMNNIKSHLSRSIKVCSSSSNMPNRTTKLSAIMDKSYYFWKIEMLLFLVVIKQIEALIDVNS